MTTPSSQLEPTATPAQRLEDLAEVMRTYNRVTENLQKSHEALQAEVVRLQEQLASTNAQLQRSKRLAALGEMAAGIAHEVRNPLAAIGLYANMIAEDLAPVAAISQPMASTAQTAQKIAAAVRGLNAVVNDVLAFARDLAPMARDVPTVMLFERAVDAHRHAIEAAEVEVRIEGDADATVHADTDLLHQALLNLIRNAIDAMTDKSARRPRVLTLSAHAGKAGVVLTVRDTGPGIEPENIDRIFNPFFTTRNTGTGLGLAIVHRILDAHGGAISVTNDSGAVFELVLPSSLPSTPGSAGGFFPRTEAADETAPQLMGATR